MVGENLDCFFALTVTKLNETCQELLLLHNVKLKFHFQHKLTSIFIKFEFIN